MGKVLRIRRNETHSEYRLSRFQRSGENALETEIRSEFLFGYPFAQTLELQTGIVGHVPPFDLFQSGKFPEFFDFRQCGRPDAFLVRV